MTRKLIVLRRALLLLPVVLFFAASIQVPEIWSDWYVFKRIQIGNPEKNHLRFDRANNGAVRAWVILKKKEGAFYNKSMVYKVDDFPVQRIDQQKVQVREGSWVRWPLPCPDKNCLESPVWQQFLNGSRVVFQFEMPDGEISETVFSLKGIKKAAAELQWVSDSD